MKTESDIYQNDQGQFVLRIKYEGKTHEIVLAAETYIEACAHADACVREIRMYHICPGVV